MNEEEFKPDLHFSFAQAILGCQAFIGLVFTCMSPFSGWMAGTQDPEFKDMGPVGGAIVFGLMGAICFGSFGVLSLAGLVGLTRRKSWGWYCAIVAFGLWFAGLCFPIGAYGAWAIGREDVRKHFV